MADPTPYSDAVLIAAVVPIKSFRAAKARLGGVLTADQRADLARWLASGVVRALAEVPTYVACDDDEVADWATSAGATVVWGAGLGLNGAVDDGVRHVITAGHDHVIVTHADLPAATHLPLIATEGRITLVPDRRCDGTNVMTFPSDRPLQASYGPGSFGRHLAQAMSTGGVVEVRHDIDLSFDVDTVRDLTHPSIKETLPSWLHPLPAPTNPVNLR